MGDERDNEHAHHVSGRRRKGAAPTHRYARHPPPAITRCQCHFPLRVPAPARYPKTKKLSVSSIEEEVWWWNQQTRPKGLTNRPIANRKDRHPGWGGRRPGAGAPKGNLNALKHGRNSRRQAQLVEALMQVPQTRDTLIALGKRNRRLRRQAEDAAGVLMTRLPENVAQITLNQARPEHGRRGTNQDQNNQE